MSALDQALGGPATEVVAKATRRRGHHRQRQTLGGLVAALRVTGPSAFLLTSVVLIMVAPTPPAALCMPPLEVTDAAPAGHRYVWFLIESVL